ncbi:MAG: DUF2274 domain-containing protein [Bacteroidota bacterium]
MPKLKLTTIPDDRPVRLTITFTGEQHRLLAAYAQAVSAEAGRAVEPAKLVPHIVERFIATDRAFARKKQPQPVGSSDGGAGT